MSALPPSLVLFTKVNKTIIAKQEVKQKDDVKYLHWK